MRRYLFYPMVELFLYIFTLFLSSLEVHKNLCVFGLCHVTVLFKNKKALDLVLEVNKDNYDKCNIDNPIKKMDDENSVFDFDRS
ncbi:hypothetical protein H5410_000721, partial [Solanum commersonii]